MTTTDITMEWRVQQHAREAVESTASGATAAVQQPHHQSSRMKKKMEESHTGLIKASWLIKASK